MYSIFWKSIFISFMVIFIGVNIAFTFDLVEMINPMSVLPSQGGSYSDYYFGFSSFIDNFKNFFGNASGLSGYQTFLTKFGKTISTQFDSVVLPYKALGGGNPAWEIISLLWAIFTFTNNLWFVIELIIYVIFYIIFLIAFVFTFVSFVVATFSGAFATPLPHIYDF